MGFHQGSFAGAVEGRPGCADSRQVGRQHRDQTPFQELSIAPRVANSQRTLPAKGSCAATAACSSPQPAPEIGGYEVQILDSWKNKTYVNGQAASIYKQAPPLVNAMRTPGEWQDLRCGMDRAAFQTDGTLKEPAYVTVFHNGVLVQNHFQLSGETVISASPLSAV